MAITIRTTSVHWNYFLALENDLQKLSRYVEFAEANFDCFSLEISRILFAAASEADVVAKQLCRKISAKSAASSVHPYRRTIMQAYPGFADFKVTIPRFGMEPFKPWERWKLPDGVPIWWTAYNKVKHHRNTEYHQGNLKNALNSVGGLFILILYLYRENAENAKLLPIPSLFRVTDENFDGTTFNDVEYGIHYKF